MPLDLTHKTELPKNQSMDASKVPIYQDFIQNLELEQRRYTAGRSSEPTVNQSLSEKQQTIGEAEDIQIM